jgi:hypothetical protein
MATPLFPGNPDLAKPRSPRFLPANDRSVSIRPAFVSADDVQSIPSSNHPGLADNMVEPDRGSVPADAEPQLAPSNLPEAPPAEEAHPDPEAPADPTPDLREADSPAADFNQEAEEANLKEIVEILSSWKHRFVEQSRMDSVELAFIIAEKLIKRELERDPDLIKEIIASAHAEATESSRMTLLLHPADRALLNDENPENLEWLAQFSEDLQIEEDPTMQRGDCILDSELESIDGRIQVRLATLAIAARQALAPAPEQEPL